MSSPYGFHFDNGYTRLPERLFARCEPTPVAAPVGILFNRPLAEQLGLDAPALDSPDGAALLAGNTLAEGSEPIAQAYAGHQFGYPNMLGDGRAILLGEQLTPDGQRRDIQLKGAGRTPFSRGGDGRAALGPMLREYLISEAMHALGIATTRSLAVVATGERHVIGIHHAVNKTDSHPVDDQIQLPFHYRVQQRQGLVVALPEFRIMALQRVVHQCFQ